MRLRTANLNRKRALRRRVLRAAFEFDMRQIARGRDRSNSRFVRRMRRTARQLAKPLAHALGSPSRPWLRLGLSSESEYRDRYEGQNMAWVATDMAKRRRDQ